MCDFQLQFLQRLSTSKVWAFVYAVQFAIAVHRLVKLHDVLKCTQYIHIRKSGGCKTCRTGVVNKFSVKRSQLRRLQLYLRLLVGQYKGKDAIVIRNCSAIVLLQTICNFVLGANVLSSRDGYGGGDVYTLSRFRDLCFDQTVAIHGYYRLVTLEICLKFHVSRNIELCQHMQAQRNRYKDRRHREGINYTVCIEYFIRAHRWW